MQFLKTLFWVVLAIVAVIFAMPIGHPVTVNLWGGVLVETKLPVLLFGAFALGFLPTFAFHRATRWRLRRRLDSHERIIADMRGLGEVPVEPAASACSRARRRAAPIVEPPAQS